MLNRNSVWSDYLQIKEAQKPVCSGRRRPLQTGAPRGAGGEWGRLSAGAPAAGLSEEPGGPRQLSHGQGPTLGGGAGSPEVTGSPSAVAMACEARLRT